MTLVRNNKTSPINLPAGRTLIAFRPGTHDYPDQMLNQIEMSRKSVRAYMEPGPKGETPALELDPDGAGSPDAPPDGDAMNAKETIEVIKQSSDVELLHRLARDDTRKTVVIAAQHRLDELQELAAANQPPPPQDGQQDGADHAGDTDNDSEG